MLNGMEKISSPNQPITAGKEVDTIISASESLSGTLFSMRFSECSFYINYIRQFKESTLKEKEEMQREIARLKNVLQEREKELAREKEKVENITQRHSRSHHYLHQTTINLAKQCKQHAALASIGLFAFQSNNSEGARLCLEQIGLYDVDDQGEWQQHIVSGLQNISFCRTIKNRAGKLGLLAAVMQKISHLSHFDHECIKSIKEENGQALKVLGLFFTQKDIAPSVLEALQSSQWVSTFIDNLPKNYPTRAVLLRLKNKRQRELKTSGTAQVSLPRKVRNLRKV